jgi:hypothetical protein
LVSDTQSCGRLVRQIVERAEPPLLGQLADVLDGDQQFPERAGEGGISPANGGRRAARTMMASAVDWALATAPIRTAPSGPSPIRCPP